MKLFTNEQQNSHQTLKICCICKEKFENKHARDTEYHKVMENFHQTGEYRGAVHSICDLKYSAPKEGENTEKYITFTVPIEKDVTRIDRSREEVTKHISYRLQVIESTRFMASSFSILLIILLNEFIELNVNRNMIIKNMKHTELNTKIASAFLNTQALKIIQ